ncbi:MAG TPA: glycosyltransferase family 1 protein [Longimicrobiales bacterium]|nr:glycosyltransferase family 1 protein [Longimicrobiales bacterium]
MRIALFTDTFVPSLNGVARVLGLLIEHANRRGHEIGVVSPFIEDRDWPGTSFHLRLPGIELPFYREFMACRPYVGREGSETLRAFAPDLVHLATEALVGMAGRSWARAAGVPVVTSYCTNFPEYLAGYNLGLLEKPVWSHLRRFHDEAVISFCPSEATRRELREQGFHDRFRIWGRGVDSTLFHPRRRNEALRRALAPEADVLLLYVGRIAPEKRLDLLVDAFPELQARTDARLALVLVGGGPAVPELQARAPEGVVFAGYRRGEDLAAHYASGDVFLFPSDTETFGQVVTEAMASGLPVVAPARGGVLDTVRPGDTGALFEPGSVDDLVKTTLPLIERPGLRAELGARARLHAEARSWSRVFDGLFADYGDALSSRNGSVTKQTTDRATA